MSDSAFVGCEHFRTDHQAAKLVPLNWQLAEMVYKSSNQEIHKNTTKWLSLNRKGDFRIFSLQTFPPHPNLEPYGFKVWMGWEEEMGFVVSPYFLLKGNPCRDIYKDFMMNILDYSNILRYKINVASLDQAAGCEHLRTELTVGDLNA